MDEAAVGKFLAHVAWTATYTREDEAAKAIDFDVHYLVQQLGGEAKVFGWCQETSWGFSSRFTKPVVPRAAATMARGNSIEPAYDGPAERSADSVSIRFDA
jgi:hypothetical protein